ncbi:uncharacterized protein LOC124112159 isoform X3 [Haliotis rufescens]|uniref:uncharacterized protein LOC124112159 isoform X3 n=1 Tax=Haliotis rufescens TaxID=6454 RepID=UPI00201F9720|nr:uncharacterized protein LOC124112159 isoform X3 [Haliotis rufescens]
MAKAAILLLILGMIHVTTGVSCDVCKSTYDTSISAGSDQQKCTAAKTYITCLVTATQESGCDKRAERLKVAQDEVARVHSIIGLTCVLTDSCLCQVAFYSSNLRDPVNKCYASVVQDRCAIAAADRACDDVTTNAVYSVSTSNTWVGACSGQDFIRHLSLKAAILVATVARLLQKQ